MMATHWDWQRPHTRRLAATLLVIVRSKIKESDVKFFQYISLFTSLHLALPSTQCVRPHLSKTGNRDGRLESQRRKSLACSDRVSWPRVILKEMNWFCCRFPTVEPLSYNWSQCSCGIRFWKMWPDSDVYTQKSLKMPCVRFPDNTL